MWSGLGDPPPHAVRQERTAHGAPVPIAYVPKAPLKTAGLLSGKRRNGRRADETRLCRLSAGTVPAATGSAYIEQGGTKVVAAVYGPRQAEQRQQRGAAAEGILAVDVSFAAFCSQAFAKEEADKRALLYSGILQRSLESIVLLERYSKAAFDVHLLVLEDDGAVLTAALTAASLALADAAVELRDLATGATVHLAGGLGLLLDCELQEEQALPEGSSILHLGICPSSQQVCMLHSSGPLPLEDLEKMVALAKAASAVVGAEMRNCLEGGVKERAAKRRRLEELEAAASDDDDDEEEAVEEEAT